MYVAEEAHTEYRDTLVDSRIGWDLSYSDAKALADILRPLLKQGQSLDFILRNHPEIKYCEKTLYNYIEQGALSQFGITNMDLRRKVSRRMTKKKKESYKPRQDRKYLKGRTYDDFLEYIKEHPEASVVEMDTVYNDISNGPFMQTFQFVKQHFMKGVFHDTKTADDMYEGVKLIYDQLGEKNFKKHVQVILTDRGSEFTCADRIEALGCKIFYCDPMCSWQKPHVENNHVLLRYICPKETDLKRIGLDSQEKLDLAFSHINSYGRESLNGRSPYETFEFFHPDSDILDRLKIKKVAPNQIILKPELLKK
jgi:IS30 family transposase